MEVLFLYSYILISFPHRFLVVVLLYTLHLLMLKTQEYIVIIIILPSVISLARYSFIPIYLLCAVIGKCTAFPCVIDSVIHYIYVIYTMSF